MHTVCQFLCKTTLAEPKGEDPGQSNFKRYGINECEGKVN